MLRDLLGRLGGRAPATPAPAAVAQPWRELGNQALAQGRLDEAARCYEQGILAEPQDAALRLNHGFVLLEQGRYGPAADRLRQALALRRPGDGCAPEDAHFLLARAQVRLGRAAEAAENFAAALEARPEFPEALAEGVGVLDSLKRHDEAATWMHRLVSLQPTHANRLVLASQLRAAERDAEALDVLDVLCAEAPTNVEAAVMRSAALKKAGRYAEALAEIDRVLALQGWNARTLVMRAALLEAMGRHEEALTAIEQAFALDPGSREVLLGRGPALTNLLRMPEAVAAAEDAVRRLPDDGDAHFAAALAFLLAGDLARGWAEHEWRDRTTLMAGKLLAVNACPRWRGEDLRGRTIFLHGEQGIGDNIQFVRYANVVARMADHVIVMVSRVLEPLVARSLAPNCRVLPQESPLPAADYHCPLLSVPAVLGTTVETVPAGVPYLRADPAVTAAWRERLDPAALNVGIAWTGNPKHANDHNRSMSLATFRAVDAEGCRFLTAQPDVREADRPVLDAWDRATDLGAALRTFDDTAGYFEALDLVITVDTSVAHLAGALGRPVWILLPYVPDWRWMLGREDTPWYPTARLYRQAARGDWASVLARVRQDLAALARAPRVRALERP